MNEIITGEEFYDRVIRLLEEARKQVKSAIDTTMVYSYYEIGRVIIEEEQKGLSRAEYGKAILQGLSERLTERFGKGFSLGSLKVIRRFYVVYSRDQIGQTLSAQFKTLPVTHEGRQFYLSFSHYVALMRIQDINERHFYEIEAVRNGWSLKEMRRQFDSSLYERLALSRDKEGIMRLAAEGQIIEKPEDMLKDPYVLEFTGLPELASYNNR